jgi:hypothetical protein
MRNVEDDCETTIFYHNVCTNPEFTLDKCRRQSLLQIRKCDDRMGTLRRSLIGDPDAHDRYE